MSLTLFRRCLSFLLKLPIRGPTVPNLKIHRYVSPTLMELKNREKRAGGKKINPRNTFLEWNLEAELYAFGKRLHEDFDSDLLLQAFTDRSYVIKEELKQKEIDFDFKLKDNRELAAEGEEFMTEYIQAYLEAVLPRLPAEGLASLKKYLMSETVLSYVSSHLGTKDIILAKDYPVEPEILVNTLKALIGALLRSSGETKAAHFVRDFVITQLQGQDLSSYWHIEDPWGMLGKLLAKNNQEVEPRLLGDVGSNTLLACYHIGLYIDRKLFSTGFGEDITTAKEMAAREALRKIFGISENMPPLNFQLKGIPKADSKQRYQIAAN